MKCIHCNGENVKRMRNIISNGDSQVFDWCIDCDKNARGAAIYLKHGDIGDPEQYPIKENYYASAPRCVRCGSRGAEYHHWAPKAVFGNAADLWPGDYLCQRCHDNWHDSVKRYFIRSVRNDRQPYA